MSELRLSEMIRLGAMLKPQGYGSSNIRELAATSCAVQAAVEAAGGQADMMDMEATRLFPIISKLPRRCHLCDHRHGVVGTEPIWHLNDVHRWTREQIADWVETIEHQQQAAQETPVAVEVG